MPASAKRRSRSSRREYNLPLDSIAPKVLFSPGYSTLAGDRRLYSDGVSVCMAHYDVSDRLIECFSDAGLPRPNLFCETPIGGGADSPLYAWAVETLRSCLPRLAKVGIVGIEALEIRLREAVVAARSQIAAPGQVCVWART